MDVSKLKWIYLSLLSLIWGSSFILIDLAMDGLTPIQVGSLRVVVTGIFILSAGANKIKLIESKQWKWIFWTALAGSLFPMFLFAIAQDQLDSSVASMLNSLVPLHTIVFGVLFFGVVVQKRQIFGVLIGLIGALVLVFAGAEFNPNQNYWYSIFILLATIGYGLNVNIIKRYLNDLNAIAIVAGNFVIITIPGLIILWYTGFFETILENEAMQIALGYVAILSLFGSAIAKVIYSRLVQISSPVFASSVTYTMPVVAIFWGVIFGEKLSLYQLLGGVIILLGVYLVNNTKKKKT
ncbi:EamA family transporter [Kordia algicida OT-1]|uniref:Predicted permease n=1 Tax=Kordia algicida OT-1 TaxID=391587 RepID=A9DL69_9FLAO|nr:EamA family transporter [Kordia algicida]EDP98493.1 Predicted permease [Kordia algicida OT-1]